MWYDACCESLYRNKLNITCSYCYQKSVTIDDVSVAHHLSFENLFPNTPTDIFFVDISFVAMLGNILELNMVASWNSCVIHIIYAVSLSLNDFYCERK